MNLDLSEENGPSVERIRHLAARIKDPEYANLIEEVVTTGSLDSAKIDRAITLFDSFSRRNWKERRILAWVLGYAAMSGDQELRAVAALSRTVNGGSPAQAVRRLTRSLRYVGRMAWIAVFAVLLVSLTVGRFVPLPIDELLIGALFVPIFGDVAASGLGLADAQVRMTAILSLGLRRRRECVPTLLRVDKNTPMFFAAAAALTRIFEVDPDPQSAPPGVVSYITRLLDQTSRLGGSAANSPDSIKFWKQSIGALRRIGQAEALPSLRLVIARDRLPGEVRSAARNAVSEIEAWNRERATADSLLRASAEESVRTDGLVRAAEHWTRRQSCYCDRRTVNSGHCVVDQSLT